MKILIDATAALMGGGQTYLINLLNYTEILEHDIIILSPKKLTLPSIQNIHRIDVDKSLENPFIRAVWMRRYLPDLIKERKVDILFCPGGLITKGIPSNCVKVTMFRNMIPFDLKQRVKYPLGYMRFRNWLLERLLLDSMIEADLVIFISEYASKVIKKRAKKKLRNTVIIPHGLSAEFRIFDKKAIPRPQWLPAEDYLLYVSILDVYKAQIELIQGFALLKKWRQTSEKLLLVGPDEERSYYTKMIKKEIVKHGLQNDVIITGPVPYNELPALYYHAKVNIFASECENCPNILLEALGAGRPTLVSDCEPMPEFGGDSVEYFDPTSPEDFANSIIRFIDDENKMKELAKKAGERSLLFDWEKVGRLTWQSIENIYNSKTINM